MLRKIFTNRVVLNTIVLTAFTFIIEMVIRIFTSAPLLDIAVLRIFLSSLIMGITVSYINHFFPKLVGRILSIIYVLFIGIYEFIEFGLYNYLGFFMGIGNSEQGTKVLGYILDFMKSLKPEYYLILLPTILFVVYYIIVDRLIMKRKKRNNTFTTVQKVYIEVVTFIAIVSLCGIYYLTITSESMQNELQTDSNYSLWLYPENSNLTVNNFGVAVYGFADIKSNILGIDAEDVMRIEEERNQEKDNENINVNKPVITDNSRIINDDAWKMLINNTNNENYNNLNNYFINREITEKNEMTGIFEGKNLIIILMESVNEISILNKEDFPTLYKLYHEGISFRNNFTPRNNCSTGNNEFTVLSSLFTINNTCTANTYASNEYFEGVFNIFKNKGYHTSSYHDYTQMYYQRRKIHRGLGNDKFYSVTDLKIPYDPKYEEWPSDVDMFKQAKDKYMGEEKFMAYFASVTTHQTYNVPSTMGDKYKSDFTAKGYSTTLSRYLSKMREFDHAMEELLKELESEGKLEDTVIAMFGDHFPYGLTDSQINEYLSANNANYKVNRNSTTGKDVDRTPLIIYNAGMDPIAIDDYTSIIDLLPTLLNMFNMDYDPRLYLGTDIFSKSHKSRVVFADGSWQSEIGYYHAPSSKMTYVEGAKELSGAELKDINKEINRRQKMSATAIKSNYFKYLGDGLKKYQAEIDEKKQKEQVVDNNDNESEE